jgi:hypothetical protein
VDITGLFYTALSSSANKEGGISSPGVCQCGWKNAQWGVVHAEGQLTLDMGLEMPVVLQQSWEMGGGLPVLYGNHTRKLNKFYH